MMVNILCKTCGQVHNRDCSCLDLAFIRKELARCKQWVADLQSGMYVNCVYCGHRYGPEKNVPVSMAEILKEHIEKCPDHPMSHLKTRNAALTKILEAALHCVRSYQYGNAAPALAEEMWRRYRGSLDALRLMSQLRHCRCDKCAAQMLLAWDDDQQQYVALCEECKAFTPLFPDDKPPRTQ